MSRPFHHYYHVFCGTEEVPSKNWAYIVHEHFDALEETGLMDALDYMGVGLVGTSENRESAKNLLESRFGSKTNGKFEIVEEADFGWEQTTMRNMKFSEPTTVLYCHTKGSAYPSQLQERWRVSMINSVIFDWERCVEAIEKGGLSAIGCFFRPAPWFSLLGNVLDGRL